MCVRHWTRQALRQKIIRRAAPKAAQRKSLMARLLLIDDDPVLIPEQIRHAFPSPSHQVDVAVTGAAGLEIVASSPPDIILLDLHLPDQSGLDVFRQVRLIDARI